jgi:hypothetical protein
MHSVSKSTELLVRESSICVNRLRTNLPRVHAWDALQEKNEDGAVLGPLPYTEDAIREFEVARKAAPNDLGITHHLAIAHHSRAWDLELSDDPRVYRTAEKEWETALGYWQTLAAAPAFWTGLKDKFLRCKADADVTVLDGVRTRLIEDLLDIHVDFVRHYCEMDKDKRAEAHVRLVQRADIRPATKKELSRKVFEAMTESATRDPKAGLVRVEAFLKLFPDPPSLPALRMHAELTLASISGLSYQDHWDEILDAGEHALPFTQQLAGHPELDADPMARNALEELAFAMAIRGRDGAAKAEPTEQTSGDEIDHCFDLAIPAYEFAVRWGRLGYAKSREGAHIRDLFPACLHNCAMNLCAKGMRQVNGAPNPLRAIPAALPLLRESLAKMTDAQRCAPGDPEAKQAISEHLDLIQGKLSELELLAGVGP